MLGIEWNTEWNGEDGRGLSRLKSAYQTENGKFKTIDIVAGKAIRNQ